MPRGRPRKNRSTETTSDTPPAPTRRRRASSMRHNTPATAASKEHHETEAASIQSGLKLLDEYVKALEDLQKRNKKLKEPPNDLNLSPSLKTTNRDWGSRDVLGVIEDVIDEHPQPTLEYVLGVLGLAEVPKNLEERQRSLGSRAFNTGIKNRSIRTKRELREAAEREAKEEAERKEREKAERAKAKELALRKEREEKEAKERKEAEQRKQIEKEKEAREKYQTTKEVVSAQAQDEHASDGGKRSLRVNGHPMDSNGALVTSSPSQVSPYIRAGTMKNRSIEPDSPAIGAGPNGVSALDRGSSRKVRESTTAVGVRENNVTNGHSVNKMTIDTNGSSATAEFANLPAGVDTSDRRANEQNGKAGTMRNQILHRMRKEGDAIERVLKPSQSVKNGNHASANTRVHKSKTNRDITNASAGYNTNTTSVAMNGEGGKKSAQYLERRGQIEEMVLGEGKGYVEDKVPNDTKSSINLNENRDLSPAINGDTPSEDGVTVTRRKYTSRVRKDSTEADTEVKISSVASAKVSLKEHEEENSVSRSSVKQNSRKESHRKGKKSSKAENVPQQYISSPRNEFSQGNSEDDMIADVFGPDETTPEKENLINKRLAAAEKKFERRSRRTRAIPSDDDEDEIRPASSKKLSDEEHENEEKADNGDTRARQRKSSRRPNSERKASKPREAARSRSRPGRSTSRRTLSIAEKTMQPVRSKRLRRESTNLIDGAWQLADRDPHILRCVEVWEKINKNRITIPFREPVTEKDAPGYFSVVKRPMDMQKVKRLIEDGEIKSPLVFYRTMTLICSNAMQFNDSDSDIFELAVELQTLIKKECKDILNEWRKENDIDVSSGSESNGEVETRSNPDRRKKKKEEVVKRTRKKGRPRKTEKKTTGKKRAREEEVERKPKKRRVSRSGK